MDYPVGLEAGVCTVFSLDIILKFSKAVILEFSDSPTKILMVFLSRKTVGRVMRTKYFLGDRLKNWYRLGFLHEKYKNHI